MSKLLQCSKPLVLVTGATGYVATHIIKLLLDSGYKVRGTTRDLQCSSKVDVLRKLAVDGKSSLEIVEAELLEPQSWLEAVQGCTYVIHTASPVLPKKPRHDDDILKPAVEGTLNVLQACKRNVTVKRVVLTSSLKAVNDVIEEPDPDKVFSEKDWASVTDNQIPYTKSKILAEQAAWDFVKGLSGDESFELAVIHTSFIVGTVLCGGDFVCAELVTRLLASWSPFIANLSIAFVDIGDVALAHVKAMTIPEAAGHRHIINGKSMWMSEIADVVRAEFEPQGYHVPTRCVPNWLLNTLSFFHSELKATLMKYRDVIQYDNTRMRDTLGINPRDTEESIIDMCYSMIDNGSIARTRAYKGRRVGENTQSS